MDGFDTPFTGSVPWTVQKITEASGADGLGAYTGLIASGATRSAGIRLYGDSGAVLFTDTCTAPSNQRDAVFPEFVSVPSLPYRLGYDGIFALKTFNASPPYGPWVWFDQNRNAVVLSPAAHFNTTRLIQTASGSITTTVDGSTSCPSGYVGTTLLIAGHGIGDALARWGHALMALNGKSSIPNDGDVVLDRLGYWTDAG